MRVMTDSLGIISEDYIENQVIKVQSDLYTGFDTMLVSDEDIDDIYSDNLFPSYLDNVDLNNNQSIMMVSEINEKKSVLCRYRNGKFRKVLDLNKKGVWGIKPRNKEQVFALDLLMDAKVPLVTLVGRAGSGKTLMAIAAGIAQTITDPFSTEEPNYSKIVISRPVQPLGNDIGYVW